jgi:hypothetical protein
MDRRTMQVVAEISLLRREDKQPQAAENARLNENDLENPSPTERVTNNRILQHVLWWDMKSKEMKQKSPAAHLLSNAGREYQGTQFDIA